MDVQEKMEWDLYTIANNSIRIANALERLADKFAPISQNEDYSS